MEIDSLGILCRVQDHFDVHACIRLFLCIGPFPFETYNLSKIKFNMRQNDIPEFY